MSTMNIFDMTDTWNASGTTFAGIKLNVTDTASASGSLLLDLQVGGVSKFSVRKDGVARGTLIGSTTATFGIADNCGIGFYSASRISVLADGQVAAVFAQNKNIFNNGRPLGFEAGATGGSDLDVYRDAADTLAQRRSTNPQAFRAYNTFTDASNYERGKIAWESNVLRIGTEKAGTGSARALELQTDGVTRVTIAANGSLNHKGRVSIDSSSDGIIYLANNAANDFNRLQFGGTTSSFPALKRSTTSLQARLADDSAFTNVQGKLTTETAYTAGAPTATGYIVLYDSTGTAYKVPAEAL